MTLYKNGRTVLPDGKTIFEMYHNMGRAKSTCKLQLWCKRNGYINENTGKPPTRMGIWFRMWRWALNNPEEAYPVAEAFAGQHGQHLTKEAWYKHLLERTKTAFTAGQRASWIEKNSVHLQ